MIVQPTPDCKEKKQSTVNHDTTVQTYQYGDNNIARWLWSLNNDDVTNNVDDYLKDHLNAKTYFDAKCLQSYVTDNDDGKLLEQ